MRATAAGSRRRAPTRSAAVRSSRLTLFCFPPVPTTYHQLPVKGSDEAIGSAQLQLALDRALSGTRRQQGETAYRPCGGLWPVGAAVPDPSGRVASAALSGVAAGKDHPVSMLVADARCAAGHPSEAQTPADTRRAIATSSATHAGHSLPRATVPEVAPASGRRRSIPPRRWREGQQHDRWNREMVQRREGLRLHRP